MACEDVPHRCPSGPGERQLMDIETAFSQGAIDAMETAVGGAEEDELRRVIRLLREENQMDSNEVEENVNVLLFVAGRTYQADLNKIMVPMSGAVAGQFMAFLEERGL